MLTIITPIDRRYKILHNPHSRVLELPTNVTNFLTFDKITAALLPIT